MHVETERGTANELYWYAICSRSRHERMVATALTNGGVTTFLPLVSEMHSWSDRRKPVDVPLFPGYIFVQIPNSADAKLQVLKTSGVARFVGNGKRAIPVRDKEISDVRAVLEHKISYSPYPFLQLGQRVRIRGGSLDGVEGILVRRDSASKLVISIQLIQRSLAVTVCNFDVEPIAGYDSKTAVDSETGWLPSSNVTDPRTLSSQSRAGR